MPFFDLFQQDTDPLKINGGEVLFRQGDPGNTMYVLLEGEAEIFIDDVLFEKCAQGAIVGEIAVIEHAPRRATVVAVTPCTFAVVDSRRFHFLVEETPGFAVAVMQVLCRRLTRSDDRVIELLKQVSP